jgi:hypothetical protein
LANPIPEKINLVLFLLLGNLLGPVRSKKYFFSNEIEEEGQTET